MTADLQQCQAAMIEQWLHVFHPLPGEVVELRVPQPGSGKLFHHCYTDLHELALRAVELDAAGAKGCYFTANPLKPEMAGHWASARKDSVLVRHWLLVDCDSDKHRSAGTNASEPEKEAGWRVLLRCRGLLDTAGLTGAVVGDSGNGWHLNYPIEAPCDEASQALLKVVLARLVKHAGEELAGVTPSTHDAPRIWKLYGTRARKGPHTPQRPHRWSRLVEGEPWEQARAIANWKALECLPRAWQTIDDLRAGRPPQDASGSILERARAYVEKMPAAVAGQRGHDATFKVALTLVRGFGLSPEEAWVVLCEYNARCVPPWSESDLRHKLDSAQADSRAPVGYLLGAAPPSNGQAPPTPAAAAAPSVAAPSGPSPSASAPFAQPIPVIELKKSLHEQQWLWKGLLARGEITLFSALWKAGKTTLLAYLLRSLAEAGEFVGHATLPARVLYVTEEHESRWAERRDKVGLSLCPVDFLIRPFASRPSRQRWEEFVGHLGRLVAARAYDLVALDTLSGFWPVSDENDAVAVQAALMPLHLLTADRAAVLAVHHVRKSDGTEATAARGSGALPAFVDTIIEFRRYNPNDRTDRKRVMTCYGRSDETPAELVVELASEGYECRGGDREAVALQSLLLALRDVLPCTPPGLTVEEIVKELPEGHRRQRLLEALNRGVQDGQWERQGEGKKGSPYTYLRTTTPFT